LLAPFLIDSYELEAEVFNKGIPDQMLAGMDEEGWSAWHPSRSDAPRRWAEDAFTTVRL
jgi:hypothetical protein